MNALLLFCDLCASLVLFWSSYDRHLLSKRGILRRSFEAQFAAEGGREQKHQRKLSLILSYGFTKPHPNGEFNPFSMYPLLVLAIAPIVWHSEESRRHHSPSKYAPHPPNSAHQLTRP